MRKSVRVITSAAVLAAIVIGAVFLKTLDTHDLNWWSEFLSAQSDDSPYSKRPLRWRFCDGAVKEEKESYDRTTDRIRAFLPMLQGDWQKLIAYVRSNKTDELAYWMNRHLGAVDEQLMWEFGPSTDKPTEYRLCISHEGRYELEPIIETIVSAAARVPGLNVMSGRERLPACNIEGMFPVRAQPFGVENKKAPPYSVQCVPNMINLVDIKVTSPVFQPAFRREDGMVAFLITDLVLGERDVDNYVGNITPVATKNDMASVSVESAATDFYKNFQNAKQKIKDSLPTKPYYLQEVSEPVMVVRLDGKRITLSTSYQNLGLALADEANFHSNRFSNLDEKFCYLRVKNVGKLAEPDQREPLENELNRLLREGKMGCTIGGGYGEGDTMYIDLCLADVDRAIPVLRDFCKKHSFPADAVLLFYDVEWRHEWVGLGDPALVPELPATGERW